MHTPLSVPIIKPLNGACNMRCSYCYMNALLEPHRTMIGIMCPETLRATIDFFCGQQQAEVEFIWHGGEPLLAGKHFFKQIVAFQKPWQIKGKKIVNFLQTNGTMITQEWAVFLAKNGFTVGVSLDAPLVIHDALRRDRQGKSTHRRILQSISLLKKHGIFNGVSCCIGRRNILIPQQILDYFLGQNVKNIKFLRIKDADKNVPWFGESVSAGEYVDFLIAIFERWLHLDDCDFEIRDIRSIIDILLGGSFRECTYLGRCDQFVTVYNDGSIYACDSFLNHERMRFGTVFDSHTTLLSSDNLRSFQQQLADNQHRCKGCEWLYVCQGGCMYDTVASGSNTREVVCKENRRLFKAIQDRLKEYGLL